MGKIILTIIVLLLLCTTRLFSINIPEIFENTVNADNIKTVELYRDGWKLSNPVINLNSDQSLILSFDDLNNERTDYSYTIYHCDRNWRLSRMPQQDYLSSFHDFPVTDFEYAVNTKVGYLNYMVRLPNEEVPILFSGNYVVVVFDRNNPDLPLIIRRFYVVESNVTINARIQRANHDTSSGEDQEIDFTIDLGSYKVQDPFSDLKVVVTQNNRTDNAISNLKPLFIKGNVLEYDYNFENVFKGENEFRFFETRGLQYAGEGVTDITFNPPFYHVSLIPGELRTQRRYTYYKDMNGAYSVELYNKDYPEIEADYFFVHFTLKTNQPLLGGGVYVFGQLSNWQCNKQNEMKWSFDRNQYELTLMLKQGYYNYNFAYKDYQSDKVKMHAFEGSYFETENDYYIYVYHGRITDRYDRLIGYQKFNSSLNRNTKLY